MIRPLLVWTYEVGSPEVVWERYTFTVDEVLGYGLTEAYEPGALITVVPGQLSFKEPGRQFVVPLAALEVWGT